MRPKSWSTFELVELSEYSEPNIYGAGVSKLMFFIFIPHECVASLQFIRLAPILLSERETTNFRGCLWWVRCRSLYENHRLYEFNGRVGIFIQKCLSYP